ncbi:hypothetical protein A2U01_0097924, partial [Trifolium medium]|nr:hypothetical protein [Trifolium medium]
EIPLGSPHPVVNCPVIPGSEYILRSTCPGLQGHVGE